MKIIVLSASAHKNLVEIAQKRGHEVRVIDPDNLYLMLSDSNGHDRIYEKTDRIALKDVDAIIPRIGKNLNYGLAVVNHFVNNLGIYSTSSADGLRTASDKFWTSQKLSEARIKIPKTIFAKKPDHVDFLIDKVGGLPAVAKTLTGSQGAGVSIFETPLSANTTMQTFYKLDADVHLQQYLEAKGRDIRAIVIDRKVVVAMERTANKGDFRANLGAGGSGRKIELTEAEKDMAIRAAQSVGLGSFAGVDLVRANDTTYCIEVNGNPGSKIIDITGVNYFEALIDMVEKYAGNAQKRKNHFEKKQIFTFFDEYAEEHGIKRSEFGAQLFGAFFKDNPQIDAIKRNDFDRFIALIIEYSFL